MRIKLAVLGIGLGMLLTTPPMRAHHAFAAEFDISQPITLRGTVTKMEWTNPHCWIFVDVKDSEGKVESWSIEGAAPNSLLRHGVTKKSLMPGTEVVIHGYRAHNGSNTANARLVTYGDGRQVFGDLTGAVGPGEQK